MKTSLLLLLAAAMISPLPVRADDDEEADEGTAAEAPASGTHAEANEEAPAASPAPSRAARRAYTTPVKRSASNYTAEQASPAPAADDEEDASEAPEARPSPAPREARRAVSAPAVAPPAHGAGGGGSCGAVPKKVRTYLLSEKKGWAETQCKLTPCAPSVVLKHYRYPSVVKVGEIADFSQRCDYRSDTPCPVAGGYLSGPQKNSASIFVDVPPGGKYDSGASVTLVPIVGPARSNGAFDMSIPFELDPLMRGRTYAMEYIVNTNNPSGYQVSISACEGDFSRGAVVLNQGDLPNQLLLATGGTEGWARSAANTTRHLVALKTGKRYYLNVRKVAKAGLEVPSDSIPDDGIEDNMLLRHFVLGDGFAGEFYRFSLMAHPADNTLNLREADFASKPGFRGPGQGL